MDGGRVLSALRRLGDSNTVQIGATPNNSEFFTLRAALLQDPKTATTIHRIDHGIHRSDSIELSID